MPSGSVLRFGALAPGRLFAERYRIRHRIGAGGSGEVFEALDEMSQSLVALKVLYPGAAGAQIDRLRRELNLVRSIHHPAVLRVWDIGESEGLFYVVSELLDGHTLQDRLRHDGAISPDEAERILRGILDALSVAHARGIIHRDVKPANVFLARDASRDDGRPRVVLLDFGLARQEGATGLTSTGHFLGTPEYCAPEQVRGDAELGPACDLYACGITLWEMLSGAPPFDAGSDVEKLTAHLERDIPDPDRCLPHVRPALRALAACLLEKDPRRRPVSAAAALEWLGRSSGRSRRALLARRLRSARPWQKLAALAVIALTVSATAAWGLYPVGCEVTDGGGVRWTTRAGLHVERPLPDHHVALATLAAEPPGLSRATWIAIDPALDPPQDTEGSGRRAASFVFRLSSPWSAPEPVAGAARSLVSRQEVYEGNERAFSPYRMLDLGHVREEGEARLAVFARQDPTYASALLLIGVEPEPWNARYLQPGYVEELRPYRASSNAPLQLIGTAFNNHLAHRIALFSLPAGRAAQGQAPPFRGHDLGGSYFDAANWYRVLPAASHPRHVDLQLDATPARAKITGERGFTFEPTTGVPIEDWAREGLSRAQWRRAHERAWTTMNRAAALALSGDRDGAAQLLETLGEQLQGPVDLRAIVFTLAARHRLAMAEDPAADPPGEIYTRVLEDVRAALALGVEMPDVDLLEAEMLARLGDREAVGAVLDRRAANLKQHSDHLFSWYLVNRLAGMPRPLARIWPTWAEPLQEKGPLPGWELVYRLFEAHRHGRHEEIPNLVARLHETRQPWAIHRYMEARGLLDRARPDGHAALAALEQAKNATSEGTVLPLAAATVRARALAASGALDKADLERALADVERFERLARTDLSSLVMLDFALDDAAHVARATGDETLASELEARLTGSCFISSGTCSLRAR